MDDALNPNAMPPVRLSDGSPAEASFTPDVLGTAWTHVLVPRPGDGPHTLTATLLELQAAGYLSEDLAAPRLQDLSVALLDARAAQQTGWPADGWPLDRIARRLADEGIVAAWGLPVQDDAQAVEALASLRETGAVGAVYYPESDAVQIAEVPGSVEVVPDGFVQPKRGLFGRAKIDADDYLAACAHVGERLVEAARAEGVTVDWDGDPRVAVVLHDVQHVVGIEPPE